jgi:pimeloyl-ACP methyl ester carboxylesterase
VTGPLSPTDVVEVPGDWSHRRVAANGARFHIAEAGQGPLVLLLHGFPELWWAWRYQLPLLAEAGFHAVAMDLRGYGGSDKTPRGYDPFTLAEDVAGVVRSLGETRATLVGHDWGGLVAWTTAIMRPANVSRLAVVSAPHPRRVIAGMRHPRQVKAASHLLAFQRPVLPERRITADDAAYVERLLRHWSAPSSKFPDEEAAWRYRSAMQLWPAPHCALEYHRWLVRSLPRADGRRFAAKMKEPVRAPVLQIHGARDPVVLPRTAAGSTEYVAGSYRWTLVDEVGHFPHEEAPEFTTTTLLDWLAQPLLR